MLVDPELVRLAVIRDVDVDPAVAVEVGGRDAERRAERAADKCLGRHVLEPAVAPIVEQPAGLRPIAVRRTVVAPPRHAQAVHVGGGVVVQTGSHEQIEPAVPVVIDERRRHPPAPAVLRSGLSGDVGECPVAVVAKHHTAGKAGAIDVREAIVVKVANGGAHAVGPEIDAAFIGDVGEMKRARAIFVEDEIVAKQAIFQRTLRREQSIGDRPVGAKHLSLGHVYVEIAVVVVIDQRDAGRHDLGVVELARHAVEVHEVESRRLGPLAKPFGFRCGLQRLRGRLRLTVA